MENISRPDPMYYRAMKFANNYMKKHNHIGFSNLYVLQTVDRDDNVIDEKYGMNLMTDYGMEQYFGTSAGFPTTIYIGGGNQPITVGSSSLGSPLTTVGSTLDNSTVDYQYPTYYAIETGLVTVTARYIIAHFDADISGITTSIDISEYGIGTGINALWTHSWVYTNQGEAVTITKNPGERLVITVYFCMSYNKSLIESAWNNGKHVVITTMERFFYRMNETGIYTYKRNNKKASVTSTTTTSTLDPSTHEITKTTNVSPYNITAGTTDTNGYTDGLTSYTSGFLMMEHETLSTAEAVDIVVYPYTDDLVSDASLSKNFGNVGSYPFTQIDISASYTFNHLSGLYDSTETFTNTASKWYTETSMSTTYAMPIYYTSNNTIVTMYLYQNLKTNDPIVAIGGAVSAVYATDEYWDVSKWTLITNLSNIPVSERNRKYWIVNNNSVNLDPIRGNAVYFPGTEYYQYLGINTTFPPGVKDTCCSTTDGFIVCSSYLFDLSLNERFIIPNMPTDTGTDYSWIYQIRSFVMDHTSGNACVWSIKEDGGSTVYQTYRNVSTWSQTTDSTSDISNRFTAYTTYSETSDGYHILCQADGTYLDARWGGNQSKQLSGILTGCAISLSTKIAFIETASDHVVKMIDAKTPSATPTTVNIPATAATPLWMVGYNHWLYVTDGATYTYVIDTTNGTISACNAHIPYTTNLGYLRMSATESCMIVYSYRGANLSGTYLLRADNPTQISNLGSLSISGQNYVLSNLVKWNNTIILVTNLVYDYTNTSCKTYVVDLSHWMYDGTVQSIKLQEVTGGYMYMPYGKRLMYQNTLSSILNCIPHRIVGTTNTITALHNTKHIVSKNWTLQFTNVTGWSGKPPGIKQ